MRARSRRRNAIATDKEVRTLIKLKLKDAKLRSANAYFARLTIAWFLNWLTYAWITLIVITYAAMYGPEDTNHILQGWFMSLGMAMGLIEPFNIFMVALLPQLLKEDGCCMTCYNNVFFFYNEYLA